MNVLFVDLETAWRGGQHQAFLTMQGLWDGGHTPELLAVRHAPLASRAQAAGIPVHTILGSMRRARAATSLRQLLRQHQPDVLHANESHALTAICLAQPGNRVPFVVSRRVAYKIHPNFIARKRYQLAAKILAVSQFVADSVAASGLPPEKIQVIYDGVDIPAPATAEQRQQARRRWGIGELDSLIGCVSHLSPEKGQEPLLRALPAVLAQFPRARLLLAGDGPSRHNLEDLADQLGIRNAVIFAGFIEDIRVVYQASDLFTLPSRAEPLGSSLLAAMACGLPVVAVASGGVPEYVNDQENGLLAAQPDPDQLGRQLRRLLGDTSLRATLGAAARHTIADRFSAAHLVDATLHAYQEVLRDRATNRSS